MSRPVRAVVQPEWVDQYGHMNLAWYVAVLDQATDALWPRLRLGEGFNAAGFGTFAAESWVAYRRELRLAAPLDWESAVLAADEKRLLLRHRLFHATEGFLSAEQEVLYLCVDLGARRVVPWPAAVAARLAEAVTGEAAQRLALRRG
jgi:acyl-CoA thioester hydrolase